MKRWGISRGRDGYELYLENVPVWKDAVENLTDIFCSLTRDLPFRYEWSYNIVNKGFSFAYDPDHINRIPIDVEFARKIDPKSVEFVEDMNR